MELEKKKREQELEIERKEKEKKSNELGKILGYKTGDEKDFNIEYNAKKILKFRTTGKV